jgi:hypothetical protein
VSYWPLKQQLNIFAIFAKVLHSNFGPTTNPLSHISAPISPRQQRHLAFISEFNVQLLYLSGLKNVVADFLSRPLPESIETVVAMAAADPVDFKEILAEQNRCPEQQRLLGGTSLKLAFRQTGAQPQRLAGDVSTGVFRPIVFQKFRKDIFAHFHNVAHPGKLATHRIISSRFVWRDYPETSPPGPASAWPASGARSTATHAWPPNPSPSHSDVFITSMLIWWAPYSTVIIIIVILPSLIAHPNSWKLFLFLIRLLRHVQKPQLSLGFPVLVCQKR